MAAYQLRWSDVNFWDDAKGLGDSFHRAGDEIDWIDADDGIRVVGAGGEKTPRRRGRRRRRRRCRCRCRTLGVTKVLRYLADRRRPASKPADGALPARG
jgi:hypothetical protein